MRKSILLDYFKCRGRKVGENTNVMDPLKQGRKSSIVQKHYCIELVEHERGTTLTRERSIVLD